MTRLAGFFILFKTLAPILIVILFAITLNSALADLRTALEAPIETINERAERLQTNFETVQGRVEDLTDSVGVVTTRVNQLINQLPTIPTTLTIPAISIPSPPPLTVPQVSLTPRTLRYPSGISFQVTEILGIPLIPRNLSITWSNISVPSVSVSTTTLSLNIPNIPGFNVTIPGMSIVANAINSVSQTFNPVREAFDDVRALGDALGAVGDDFAAVADGTVTALNEIREVGGRWSSQVLALTLALLALLLVAFAVQILDNLRVGLHMLLTGQRP